MPENKNHLTRPIIHYDENDQPIIPPEEKRYLILLEGTDNYSEDENFRTYEFIIGRQEAYEFIKNMITGTDIAIDTKKSLVIVDSPQVHLSNAVTVYKFMKSMIESKKVDETDLSFINRFYKDEEDESIHLYSDCEYLINSDLIDHVEDCRDCYRYDICEKAVQD